jgi:hypothetical protein
MGDCFIVLDLIFQAIFRYPVLNPVISVVSDFTFTLKSLSPTEICLRRSWKFANAYPDLEGVVQYSGSF